MYNARVEERTTGKTVLEQALARAATNGRKMYKRITNELKANEGSKHELPGAVLNWMLYLLSGLTGLLNDVADKDRQ